MTEQGKGQVYDANLIYSQMLYFSNMDWYSGD
jgi:hypothetical protein